MSNLKKLAEKIHSNIKEKGYIEKIDSEKFIKLNKEEGKKVISFLAEMETNPDIQSKLYSILEKDHYRYDPRLVVLAIWVSFNTTIQKSFNSKNII